MASMWLWHSVCLLMLIAVSSSMFPRHHMHLSKTDNPLPRHVTPKAYEVKLHPHIDEGNFNGSVEINITCQEATSTITLHADHELNISHVQIKNMDGDVEITNISRNATNDTISISVAKELESGNSYKLYFVFSGQMLTNNKIYSPHYIEKQVGGFMALSFRTPDLPEKSWYAGIISTPKSLRKVLPCFDEPSFKATFQISITHLSNVSAVSVMPIESSEVIEDDLVYDHFLTTPPLSTSSVSIMLFDYYETYNINVSTANGNISVYFHDRMESYSNRFPYSRKNTTGKILEYLEEYLDVPYPLPKLDIMGVPGFFYIQSFSSLGIIVTQEFIVNEESNEMGYELTNQWFKHITTPEKWEFFNITDLLSDYMMMNARNKLDLKTREFQMQKSDLYSFLGGGFGTEMWPYNILKGRWFLEMLNSSLTENKMKIGIRNLVKNNMYSTFTPDMLWDEISKQGYADGTLLETVTVQDIANSWLNNPRFPVLTVTRNYEEDSAVLQQHSYRQKISPNLTKQEQEILWSIPITYLTNSVQKESKLQPMAWMSDKEMDINNLPEADSFLIINPTDLGMFLVNYDERNWGLISESLLSSEHNVCAQTRTKIVQDAMLLATGGELNHTTALNITFFLTNETDFKVFRPFVQQFHNFEQIVQHTPAESKFYTYIRHLLSPIVGSSTEQLMDPLDYEFNSIWYQAKAVLEKVGYQPSIDKIYSTVNKTMPVFTYYDNETELFLFCPKTPTNESEWSTYSLHMNQFGHMHFFLQRVICKCPGYTEYVKRKLNNFLDEETTFASYEFHQTIHIITNCREAHNITFNFFLEHFDELRQRFYYVTDVWTGLISGIVTKIRSEDQLEKMTHFFEENKKKFGYSNSTVTSELKMAKMMIENKDTGAEDIELWLDQVLPLVRKSD